jgi:hypothetical protein
MKAAMTPVAVPATDEPPGRINVDRKTGFAIQIQLHPAPVATDNSNLLVKLIELLDKNVAFQQKSRATLARLQEYPPNHCRSV